MDKTVFPSNMVFPELDTKHFARQLKNMADDFREVFSEQSTNKYCYVDDDSVFKDVFVDVDYIKKEVDTLTNDELEQVISHCKMLIEKNNIELGGV